MPAIVEGILLGLVLALMIGPVFFALIDLSIRKGFVPAFFLAIGISVNDALFIFISNWLSSVLGIDSKLYFWMGLVGGIVLIGYGISMLLKKNYSTDAQDLKDSNTKDNLNFIIKGFVLNGINPFVWIYWMGVASMLEANGTYDITDKTFFFIGTIATVFTTDLLKIKLATFFKQFINANFLKKLNLILGSGIILFGIKLLWDTFNKL
jgi:threonine/homoserine/homoserine lactone efflux protein